MLEEIPTKLAENYGLIGISWAVLLAAIAALFLRLNKVTDNATSQMATLAKQYAEDTRETTAALVELTAFLRGKQK